MSDNTPDVTMAALRVLFHHTGYLYSYRADLGRGYKWITLKRQLRGLNMEAADWYRHWRVRGEIGPLLDDVYPGLFSYIIIHRL